MSVLRTLRKLVLGETWVLPLGVLAVLLAGGLLDSVAPSAWEAIGAVFLPLAVLLALAAGVRGARPRR